MYVGDGDEPGVLIVYPSKVSGGNINDFNTIIDAVMEGPHKDCYSHYGNESEYVITISHN